MEYNANAPTPLLVLVACRVVDRPEGSVRLIGKLKIKVFPGSAAYRIYKKTEVEEAFHCNYELNPVYRAQIEASGMKFGGESEDGGARIMELPGHRFFMGTGYMPQNSSEPGNPHRLIVAYLKAALDYKKAGHK